MTTQEVLSRKRPEKEIQKAICQYLSILPRCYFVWHRMDQRTTCQVGTPDFVGFYWATPFVIEVKAKGQKLTFDQHVHIERAQEAGARALVAYSLDDVIKFIEGFK